MNIIITGRQNGKTAVVAKLLVLLLVCGKGITIESFSLTRAQSQNVITRTKSFLLRLPKLTYTSIPRDNMNEIVVQTSDGHTNILESRSANRDSSRGVAPDVSIVDEFGFMDPIFWEKIILPLFLVDNRMLTAITTPGAPASPITFFIREQLSKANSSCNMFNIINFSMVCDFCHAVGTPEQCRHKLYLVPPWKSFFNLHSILEVLPPESFLTEIMGESSGESNTCFMAVDVLDCFDENTMFITDTKWIEPEDNCIYITIDPTNGGDSNMAIMTFVFNRRHEIVVRN